jgi:hypothetical protein
MSTFNLNEIISRYNLNNDSLAEELFPEHKYPKLALSRIQAGTSYLNTIQLDKLASMLNVSISELFIENNWSKKIIGNTVVFFRNNYRVELNLDTHVTEIFLSDKLIAVETLISDKNIKLSEYLTLVDKTIINLI